MKKFKSALSLLTAAIMVFAMMPGAMAKTAQIADATISVFNADGTATGILAEGKTAKDVLDDNKYYTYYERNQIYTAAYNARLEVAKQEYPGKIENPDLAYNTATDASKEEKDYVNWCKNEATIAGNSACDIEKNLDKVAKFTQLNSGIEWSWETSTTVKRVDLWIASYGGIVDYKIQTSADGSKWVDIKDDSFSLNGTEATAESTLASYYPVVLDSAVSTQHLRFVIDSFRNNESPVAYVAEAKVYNTNEINLGEESLLSTTKRDKYLSPYIKGFNASRGVGYNAITGALLSNKAYSKDSSYIVPNYSDGNRVAIAEDDRAGNGVWYATTFGDSKVKVNRFGITLGRGTITQIEVWASTEFGAMDFNDNNPQMPSISNPTKWTKLATVDCNLSGDQKKFDFDVPNENAANAYMIRISKYSNEVTDSSTVYASIRHIQMYALADSEISEISKAASHVLDGVQLAENKASINIAPTFSYGGNTYNVSWESDSDYLDLTTGDIAPHDADEEITLTAKVSAGEFSYVTEKTFTLPAYENTAVITAFNGNGTSDGIFAEDFDESILTDEFYYGAYEVEKVINSDSSIATNISRVAKFTTAESALCLSSPSYTEAKRLDLWILCEGGVKDYRVQISDNGKTWTTIKDSTFVKVTEESGGKHPRASYFPVIFDEPVSTKNIKFIIDSFYETTEGNSAAYVSEVKLLNDNNINLSSYKIYGGSLSTFSRYMWGFGISNPNNGAIDTSNFFHSKNTGSIWPYPYSSGSYSISEENDDYDVASGLQKNPQNDMNGSEEGIWYVSSFDQSSVRVNKVGIKVGKGNITELEILSNKNGGRGDYWTADPVAPWKRNSDWDVVATIKCDLTPDNDADNGVYFELPYAEEACAWLIRATKYSPSSSYSVSEDSKVSFEPGTTISGVEMYALADYELTPVAPTEEKIEGTVAAGEELTFSVFSCNYNAPDAKVFFALYEDGALSGVTVAPCALSGVKTQTATYTIPATASGTLKVVAYLWDGKTLEPLVDTPVTAESTPAE